MNDFIAALRVAPQTCADADLISVGNSLTQIYIECLLETLLKGLGNSNRAL